MCVQKFLALKWGGLEVSKREKKMDAGNICAHYSNMEAVSITK